MELTKKTAFLIMLFLSCFTAIAQKPADMQFPKFRASIDTVLFRDESKFMLRCKSVSFSMKIEASKRGKTIEISFSDRADSLFLNTIKRNESMLYISEFEKYMSLKRLKTAKFILNVTLIAAESDGCPKPEFDVYSLEHLYRFNNTYISGDYFLLPPYGYLYAFAEN